MAQAHEEMAAELHEEFNERTHNDTDLAGGKVGVHHETTTGDEKTSTDLKGDIENGMTPDGEEPNQHERNSLRRVGENLPASAFLIAIVELTERFTFYGASGLFQNYAANKPTDTTKAAGIGLGSQASTSLNLFFQWWCYITPILGAIIADQYLGKYKTILIFACVYWVGLIILWTTALPSSLEHGAGIGGYVASLVVVGLGTGGIKSNIAPLIADQYQRRVMAVRTEPDGERVIIDPAITYQRIYMIFYWCINLGSLSLMATPWMEKYKGFWTAYLLCFCVFNIGIVILITRRNSYIVHPPKGSVITDAFKAIGIMIWNRNMDSAKPSVRASTNQKSVNWDDHFVDELKRALRACKVFIFYPVFWVCYNQFNTNYVTQAGQMEGHGMPNDFMQNFDPIAILIFTPILDRIVYPILRKAGIQLRPIARISIGFFLAGLCMAWGAIVQHLVYSAGPCYDQAGECAAGLVPGTGITGPDGNEIPAEYLPNSVHIAIQAPAYVFIGLAEIFISVTGLEYAYTKAPMSMKSFVQSIYLFTTAIGALIGLALVSVAVNPKYLWMYTGVAIAAIVVSIGFYIGYRHYDAMEDESYELDRDQPVRTVADNGKAQPQAVPTTE
ncbi:hypothetical protein VHEMI01915 [[Torrubiella] hemipterigena]|uniref:Uncharacterized protein n=1 Tax=[Torrubiella] hemipterigena TaxID=1531966 RepID=A0A0A1T6N4_9HYPO|nr:hypothetical protein VHEMI01915 [[Torrubiella] hemipterigena]